MKGNHVLTVAGAKGGVGKTTTSINLGACFADAGYRTAVVEADVAMANLVDFVDLDVDPREVETLHDVLTGECSVVDAVYEVDDRLSAVPSGTDIHRYPDLDVDRLESVVEHLWWHYNVVILDTPAGMGAEVVRPIELADEVVLVSTPRVSSIRNTRNTQVLVEDAGTDVRGLVLAKSGTGASPGADRIADFLDLDLLGHVPEDDAVPHSQDHGHPVVEFAPQSGAGIAYRKIARQLIETAGIEEDETPRLSRSSGDASPDGDDAHTADPPDHPKATTATDYSDGSRPDATDSADRRASGAGTGVPGADGVGVKTTDGSGSADAHDPDPEGDGSVELGGGAGSPGHIADGSEVEAADGSETGTGDGSEARTDDSTPRSGESGVDVEDRERTSIESDDVAGRGRSTPSAMSTQPEEKNRGNSSPGTAENRQDDDQGPESDTGRLDGDGRAEDEADTDAVTAFVSHIRSAIGK